MEAATKMAEHINNVDLRIKRGEDYSAQILWLSETGSSIPISPPASMEVRTATNELIAKMTTQDHTTDSSLNGQLFIYEYSGIIEIFIPSVTTKGFVNGTYFYDIYCNVWLQDKPYPPPEDVHPKGYTAIRSAISGRVHVVDNVTVSIPDHAPDPAP